MNLRRCFLQFTVLQKEAHCFLAFWVSTGSKITVANSTAAILATILHNARPNTENSKELCIFFQKNELIQCRYKHPQNDLPSILKHI